MHPAPLRSIPPRFAALYGAGVFALIFALHHNILHAGFWADDFGFLREVPAFSFRDLPRYVDPLWGWFYRPVYLIAFSLLHGLAGDNAAAFHAAGLVLHALNILLLSALVWRVAQRWWLVGLVAAGFIFHPLVYPHAATRHDFSISAVAWISSGSTLLAAFFYLLTLHGWLSWRRAPRPAVYIATLCCFVLSLCSKEDALSLPLALLICDLLLCPVVSWWQRVRYVLPFVVTGLGYLYLDATAYIHYKSLAPQTGMLRTDDWFGRFNHALNFYERMYPVARAVGVPWLNLLCIAVLGWMARQTSRPLWAVWWWSIVVALPAPLAAGNHAYATRFFYLPVLAVATFMVAASAVWWSAKQTEVKMLGAIWIAALVGPSLPFFLNDPVTNSTLLFGLAIATGLCYRSGLLGLFPLWLIVLTIGFGQLELYGPTVPPGFWKVMELVLTVGLLMRTNKRRDWRIGAAIPAVLLLWSLTFPGYCLLILLLLFPVVQQSSTFRDFFVRYAPGPAHSK